MDIQISQEDLDKIKQYKKYKRRVEEVIGFFDDMASGECQFIRIEEYINSQNKLLAETKVPARVVYTLTKGPAPIMDLGIKWDKEYAEEMVKYAIILDYDE
jgi:hypothetical protein